jgi:hypothetical protein
MDSTTIPRCNISFHEDGNNDCCSLASLLQSKLTSPGSVCLVSDNARRPSDSLLEQALLVMKDLDMCMEDDDDCEDHCSAKTEECSPNQPHLYQANTPNTSQPRPLRQLRYQKIGKKQAKASTKRSVEVQPHEKEHWPRHELEGSDLPALVSQTCALAPPTSSLQQRRKLIQVLESTMLISESPVALQDRNGRIR